MKIELLTSWCEIAKYSERDNDPLGVFELINFLPGQGDWKFVIVQNSSGILSLEVFLTPERAWTVDPTEILSGSVPQLLCASGVKIRDEDGIYEFDQIDELKVVENLKNELELSRISDWTSGMPCLTLTGFGAGTLPPHFSNINLVRNRLKTRTWMGDSIHIDSNRSVSWKALAGPEFTVSPSKLPHQMRHAKLVSKYIVDGLNATLILDPKIKSNTIRIQGDKCSREFANLTGMAETSNVLAKLGGYMMILSSNSLFELAALGRIHWANDAITTMDKKLSPLIQGDACRWRLKMSHFGR